MRHEVRRRVCDPSTGVNSCANITVLLQVFAHLSEGDPMPITSTASVATDRAPRYGKQLVSHLGRRSVSAWDETTATGTLDMNENAAHVAFSTTGEALLI